MKNENWSFALGHPIWNTNPGRQCCFQENREIERGIVYRDEFDKKHYLIESPDPIEAIKTRMEKMELKQIDLADALGGRNKVSEVLNRKRKLTVKMI